MIRDRTPGRHSRTSVRRGRGLAGGGGRNAQAVAVFGYFLANSTCILSKTRNQETQTDWPYDRVPSRSSMGLLCEFLFRLQTVLVGRWLHRGRNSDRIGTARRSCGKKGLLPDRRVGLG